MCVTRLLDIIKCIKLVNHVLRKVCEILVLRHCHRRALPPCRALGADSKMARSAKPLYEATLASICSDRHSVDHILRYESLEHLPENVALDVVCRAYQRGFLDAVAHAFSSPTFMSRVLRVMDRRKDLHQLFQVLMHRGYRPVDPLLDDFRQTVDTTDPKTAAEYALLFGKFLSEAGWFSEAEELLEEALSLCKNNILLSVDLTWWLPTAVRISAVLLKVQSVFCRFSAAAETLQVAEKLASRIVKLWPNFNLAFLYTEYSLYYFLKGLYPESYEWSMQALQALNCSVNPGVAVDVLRQATKACIVCRKFQQAKLVIKEAVMMARSCFGEQSLKYADALMDYAFYLLNVDLTDQSVEVYESALEIRSCIFIGDNINVALVHEDLAYAQYVKEYSTGRFIPARTHAEYAITIMQKLLSPNHLLLASSKRIKALILEEIAIDLSDTVLNQEYLDEAEMLHQSALQLSMEAFGEMNVQTAKHYGNLGRLYQSMKKFHKAEEMHLKAIEIKEHLLGSDDYEVALSVGHLASLYNYDMLEYGKAEKLYLRSVRIGLKLFGESYSGLEYDYRGLKSVYQAMGQHDKAAHYTHLLNIWKMVRESAVTYQEPPLSAGPPIKPEPIDVFIRGFFRKDADEKRIDNSSRSPNA